MVLYALISTAETRSAAIRQSATMMINVRFCCDLVYFAMMADLRIFLESIRQYRLKRAVYVSL